MLTTPQRDQINKAAAQYVEQLFRENIKPSLVYHTIDHTRSVVNHAAEIATHCQLTAEDLCTLTIAAWFHDTGHLFVAPKNHEEESIRIANGFLNQFPEISQQQIVQTERSILATKMPQIPCTMLENILCDADTYHFGTPEFFTTNGLMKEEVKRMGGNLENWTAATVQLLKAHQYHTAYCRNVLDSGKQLNISMLERSLSNPNSDSSPA